MGGGGDYPKRKSSGISWKKLLLAFVPIKGRLEKFGVPRLLTGLFDGSAAILIFDFFFLIPLEGAMPPLLPAGVPDRSPRSFKRPGRWPLLKAAVHSYSQNRAGQSLPFNRKRGWTIF